MADNDESSRTEEPTGKKLGEAFAKGQFARSPDVNSAFALAAAFCALLFAAPGIASRVVETSAFIFAHAGRFEVTISGLGYWLQQGVFLLGSMVFPFLATIMVAGVIAGGLQSGFRLTPDVIEWSFGKLDFVKGAQNLLSKVVFVRLGIDLLKLAALGSVIYGAVRRLLDDPIFSSPVEVMHVGGFIYDSTLYVLVRNTVACAAVAVVSYIYQWRRTRKSLMMTREEVKQERRNAEIDPKVKSAQRALARRLLQRQMLGAVPTADVVVTNPTHFAVALKYERGRDRAPVVLAKGRDVFARRIKELAAQHEVPVVENKPVARALFKYGAVGREIPAQLYQAVAEILGFVYRTHRYYFHRLKARRLGHTA
jgi:flagellar biosynthetic protein FlhB